jgi:molybdopterin-binding protein
VIELDRVTVRVGGFELADISFTVPSGGYALIIGPTGSGKTTLLEAVAGNAPLRAGRVLMHGEDVTALPPERRGLGFVYQEYHLFPHMTVRENIRYGLPPERFERGDRLADRLGIAHLLGRSVHGLSGGEQQRIALARALAPAPKILLLDEPFAAVDPATRHLLRRELRALHERERITTLQVTHDFDEALRLGDSVAVLAEGRIAQHGPPETVFRYPNSAFVARFIGSGNVLAGTVERLADAGGAPFAARFSSGPLQLEVVAEREGPIHAVIRPEDITLSRDEPSTSARNRLRATVSAVERLGPVVHVHLDAGRPLVAAVTAASAEAMDIRPGTRVMAAFKATAIRLV